jgi:hypothetical protein
MNIIVPIFRNVRHDRLGIRKIIGDDLGEIDRLKTEGVVFNKTLLKELT